MRKLFIERERSEDELDQLDVVKRVGLWNEEIITTTIDYKISYSEKLLRETVLKDLQDNWPYHSTQSLDGGYYSITRLVKTRAISEEASFLTLIAALWNKVWRKIRWIR